VALAGRRQLPETPCIYFAIDALDQVQYIGRSVNLRQRWIQHHRARQLESIGDIRISYFEVSDSELLPGLELSAIERFSTILNSSSVYEGVQSDFDPDIKFWVCIPDVARFYWGRGIGLRLKRTRGKVSRRELAARLKSSCVECSQQYIQKLETGVAKSVDASFLTALCDALDVEISALIPFMPSPEIEAFR
jgi:DNA-binding Xre family transcriptional regulator